MSMSGIHGDQILMMNTFINRIDNFFVSGINAMTFLNIMFSKKVNTVLDINAFFINNNMHVKPKGLEHLYIECIRKKNYNKYPVFNNIYGRVYDSLSECRLHHYDAIVLTAEQSIEDAMITSRDMIDMANMFVVFVRSEINFEQFIAAFAGGKSFSSIRLVPAINGKWLIFIKDKPADIGMYVVTHKKFDADYLPKQRIILLYMLVVN